MQKLVTAIVSTVALAVVPAAQASVSTPVRVNPVDQNVGIPAVVTAPNGIVTRLWGENLNGDWRLSGSRLGSTDAVTPLGDISAADGGASNTLATVAPSGVVTVVWLQRDPGTLQPVGRLQMRRISASGVVGAKVDLTTGSSRFGFPNLVTDKSGNSTVVWSDGTADEEHPYLRGIRIDSAGRKSSRFTIAHFTGTKSIAVNKPALAAASNGAVGVVFGVSDVPYFARISGTKVSTASNIGVSGWTISDGEDLALVATAGGGFRVAFPLYKSGSTDRVYSRTVSSSNRIGTATLLAISGDWAEGIELGIDSHGQASVAFYDGGRACIRLVRISSSGKVGAPVALTAAPRTIIDISMIVLPSGTTYVAWTGTPGSGTPIVEGLKVYGGGTVGTVTPLATALDGYRNFAIDAPLTASSAGVVTVGITAYFETPQIWHQFVVRWS